MRKCGLDNPPLQITFRSVAGDTNKLLFGTTNANNQIYVKRSDENFVYAVGQSWDQFLVSDFYRDPHVWNFSETNVAQVIVRMNGKTRQMVRTGKNEWSLAAGQGIIEPFGVEETVHRLGELSVAAWYGRKFTDAEAGLTTNSPSITVELNGEKDTVDIVGERYGTAVGIVTLEGERWAFVFPPMLFKLIKESLIPPDAP